MSSPPCDSPVRVDPFRTPPSVDCGEESVEWWLTWDGASPAVCLARCSRHRLDYGPTRRPISLEEYEALRTVQEVYES